MLGSLSARADVAFAGQVVEIRPRAGVVEVEFRVDQSLKGQPGAAYVLREWGGLWAAGQQRYRVGERAVIFLHATPGAALGSSVDGMEGVLPLTQLDALAPPQVDVSRLRSATARAMGEPMVDAPAQMPLSDISEIVRKSAGAPPQKIPVHGEPIIAPPEIAPAVPPVAAPPARVPPAVSAPDQPVGLPARRDPSPRRVTELSRAVNAGR